MTQRKEEELAHISILDAVETLSTIVDTDFEREIDVASPEEIADQNQMITARTVRWLEFEDPDQTVALIKDTFHVVLAYLRNFYKHEYRYAGNPQAEEGVKTIMVLVGEAAHKLDTYTTLFRRTRAKKVASLEEYKQLQEFYLTRIAKKIEESVLGKWILELTRGAMARQKKGRKLKRKGAMATEHVFIDLESVIHDTEYELFFLKKEDGSRFFNPRLTRNIKLICEFGGTIGGGKVLDPFAQIHIWQDHAMHIVAKTILEAQGDAVDMFFHEARKKAQQPLVGTLNKALMALLLSANPRNLLRNTPAKSCLEYFLDFQVFIREALKSRDYQRYIVYPPKGAARLVPCMLEVIHGLSRALFSGVLGYAELLPVFEEILHEAEESVSPEHYEAARRMNMLWSRLASDYAAMKKLIKLHPNGPLVKDLAILQQVGHFGFDPIGQANIPFQLYSLYIGEQKLTNIRCPAPVVQNFIHKARVLDEFKAFLRSYTKAPYKRKHLLINFQDRTSWREHARCEVIEQLQRKREFCKLLTVVTLAKDTDFYHQEASYRQDNQAEVFIKHFIEHLVDEQCGFFFPSAVAKKLFPKFVDRAIAAIHRVFFGEMNVLTQKNRQDFIEIFYFFLQLKLLEVERPDTFSLMCKDSVDAGGISSMGLYAFLKILQGGEISEDEIEQMNFMLYVPSLLIRERIPLPGPFERIISAMKRLEDVQHELGAKKFKKVIQEVFGRLYVLPMFETLVALPTMK